MYVAQNMFCVGGLGVVIPYVPYVFPVPLCYISASLAYVCFITCFTLHFVYPTFLVVLGGILGISVLLVYSFGLLSKCICTSVGYSYVGLFKEVSDFSDFWAVECEDVQEVPETCRVVKK